MPLRAVAAAASTNSSRGRSGRPWPRRSSSCCRSSRSWMSSRLSGSAVAARRRSGRGASGWNPGCACARFGLWARAPRDTGERRGPDPPFGQGRLVLVGHGGVRFEPLCGHVGRCVDPCAGTLPWRISVRSSVDRRRASVGDSIGAAPATGVRATAAAPGARPHRRRGGRHRLDPRPGAEPPRAGHVRGDVVGALLLQVEPHPPPRRPPRAHVGAGRAGRGRRRGRRRRRHRRRHPHREPQPPVGHRALPGRGHRRRRHPPRHLLDGGPPDRADGPAPVRSARRAPAAAGSPRASSPASPATATPSASRPSAARSCSTRPTPTTRSSTCCAWACCPAERLVLGRASGVGNLAVLLGSSTGRDGIGGASVLASAGFGDGGRRRQAPERPGGRPVRGEAAHRGVPRAARRRPGRRHPGPRRGRHHRRDQRDGVARAASGMDVDVSEVPRREPGWSRSRS